MRKAGGNFTHGLLVLTKETNMNIIEKAQPAAPARRLLLHCGGEVVSREELYAVTTPQETNTWYPLSHGTVVDAVEKQLMAHGFTIEAESHALSH